MGLNCGCPTGAHLADLEIAECKESFGQIQKIFFQRIYKTPGIKNKIPMTSGSLTKTSISTMLSAADSTKLVVSPYLNNPTTDPGAARTFGGGNQTRGGLEIIIGREPTAFTGVIYQEKQSTIATLKKYMCEEIGVYLVDENGNLGGLGGTTELLPIPINRLFIGDKKLGGFEEPDSNMIEWQFYPNWSDELVIVPASAMDFNPLTDLVNIASA